MERVTDRIKSTKYNLETELGKLMTKTEKPSKRTLILCVDHDDDIGVKASVETPIFGRSEILAAATKLAIVDPEEADANAMFEAIRTFDHLSTRSLSPSHEFHVAVIAGSERGGLEADERLYRELDRVVEASLANEAILITDGFADETLIPVIQSRLPLVSIRRVVVKHSESIEETAAVFSRYAKMLVEDPRYSRVGLGVPGLILIILGVLWYFDLLVYGGITSLIILGLTLLVKGFGIDRRLLALRVPEPIEQIRILATLAAIGMIVIGIFLGGSYIERQGLVPSPLTLQALLGQLLYLIGVFTQQAMDLFTLGACTYLIGSAIYYYFKRNARMWRMIEGVIVSIWAREIGIRAAVMLVEPHSPVFPLVVSVLLGISVSTLAIILVFALSRRFSDYFIKES